MLNKTPAGQEVAPPALRVDQVVKHFASHSGLLRRSSAPAVRAVDGVSFSVQAAETLGIVGESGCGKTTLGRLVLQLVPPTSGDVYLGDRKISSLSGREMRKIRQELQVVFQDPYASLNPRMTVVEIISEAPVLHGLWRGRERRARVADLLDRVGLSTSHLDRFPREFSGGQRQRIGIARALALQPKVIVCDEPVSALDVSIQSQILNLLADLQRELDLTYLFIAHNLAVVRHVSHRVGVMYLGRIVELAPVDDLYEKPLHPYTVSLLSAVPEPDPSLRKARIILKGDVPSPSAPPTGCHFHTRCWLYERLGRPEKCRTDEPVLRDEAHAVACHFSHELSPELAGSVQRPV